MMNRVNPALFSACFSDWVRACWPEQPDLVAIDGKTLRRSHDRGVDQPALHMVSAFATTRGLLLGQEAVSEKSNELSAIPVLLERLAAGGGLQGAMVSIDAIACNGTSLKPSRMPDPTIFWPSKPISQPCAERSRRCSRTRRRTRSRITSATWIKAAAASSSAT